MPELPEVETIVRELAPRIRGRRILSVEVLNERITRHSPVDITTVLPSRRIVEVRRHGKFIVLELDEGCLTIHLGMTGQLLFDTPPTPYTRVIFTLEDSVLLYDDTRMFGAIESGCARVERLGPDALTTLSPDKLKRKAHIKTGSLEGVRTMAGYVLDNAGQRWAVVFMANHPAAGATGKAQDALIEWVHAQQDINCCVGGGP